jgi:holo-[acyl-carrier protein] synthase
MPRPGVRSSPSIVGVGIDLFEIERLRNAVNGEGQGLLPDLFSPAEIEYGNRQREPWLFFACSFAGKEAVVKAIGSPELRGFFWREIEILPESNTLYSVNCRGAVRELTDKLRIQLIHLSLHRTDRIAIAVAVACG